MFQKWKEAKTKISLHPSTNRYATVYTHRLPIQLLSFLETRRLRFQSLAVADSGASRAEELDFEVMLWPLRPTHVMSRLGICSHPQICLFIHL